jgi:hypothetical protein
MAVNIASIFFIQEPPNSTNLQVSFIFDGFTCIGTRVARVILYRSDNNRSVASSDIIPPSGATGNVTVLFTNIPRSYIYYAIISLICDGSVQGIAQSLDYTMTGATDPDPFGGNNDNSLPGSGSTGITCSDTASDSNLTRCIAINGNNISFSGLNQLFGRPSNTVNTRLSGLYDPSGGDSLIGISYLPIDVVTPGKLRQNAVSEFRGQCNYAAPNGYTIQLVVTSRTSVENQQYTGSVESIIDFKLIWVHVASGIITERCPFENTSIQIKLTVTVTSAYTGSTTPTPYQVSVSKKLANGTTASGYPVTTSRGSTSAGTTTNTYTIPLTLNETVTGTSRMQKGIVGATSTLDISQSASVSGLTHSVLNNLCSITGNGNDVLDQIRFDPQSDTFTYNWSNQASGVGVSSRLTIGTLVDNTTSSGASGSGSNSTSGNRTISVEPSPSSNYSNLTVTENGNVLYSQTNLGTTTTTVNFKIGSNYDITALSTSAIL